ncbi:MAG: hypothetical protein A3B11_00535 [Candidatus Taylorbacteria bacterium RIFCSPLOWO2_01_FULL_44_26]|uniref:Uncharacterized protein n=2 Tax=Candidatus Tayloriibacteriota TaxID=1817919 RepID=A0A1G2MLN1_9BACT|nr:MAG: hypothetical protein A3D50_00450 [Candidatus Taylorbacteria bacterium RIFCSPHIGHO2_02_FULL_44_12]OHA31171.1 MAG: hypothetical protein A3B11_00535 [Candidatus Taylorbacteria bacterium RIFCSPLOWO2_01_FULL_44_26]
MDIEIIEQQLKKVPPEIKNAFFSVNTALQIQKIGERYGLLLDQIDDLVQETGLTMIGLKPATEFVNRISKELRIDGKTARKIADSINDEVLASIRKQARETSEKNQIQEESQAKDLKEKSNIADLERAGDFTIEKEGDEEKSDSAIKRDNYGYTEPLVDHLLSTPVAEPQQKIVRYEDGKLITMPPIQVKTGPDPYKEPIE